MDDNTANVNLSGLSAKELTQILNNSQMTPRWLSTCSSPVARKFIDYSLAQEHNILPISVIYTMRKEMLLVGADRDYDPRLASLLRFSTGKEIKLVRIPAQLLEEAVFYAYKGDAQVLNSKVRELKTNEPKVAQNQSKPHFRASSSDAALVLTSLVDYAISVGASDLHLVPKHEGCFVKLRLNGELALQDEPICSLATHAQIINRLKVLSALDTTNKTQPQDGSFVVPVANKSVHVRLSIMPTVNAEKAVLRFLGCDGLIPLEDLGLDPATLSCITEISNKQEGAIIFAGPTGSGKSTTMYALMHELSKQNLSLVSVEDPVEMQLPYISQTCINTKTGLSYASCLRSVLRQDPDVILLGEIRDEDSANIALQAALTGHLLLSTVHARSAVDVFMRLKSLGVDDYLLCQALSLIVCQRLLPKLCKRCKIIDLVSSQEMGMRAYKASACAECDYSGFNGRVLASESLTVNTYIVRKILSQEFNIAESIEQGLYRPLQHSLRSLVKDGLISLACVTQQL